jgi:hypothetical protein
VEYDKSEDRQEIRSKILYLLKGIENATAEDAELLILDMIPLLDEHPDGLDEEPLLVESVLNLELQDAKKSGLKSDMEKVNDRLRKILITNI